MAEASASAPTPLRQVPLQGIGAPVVLIMILAMMVVPMAPPVLDVLFTFNIALSIVVMLAVVYVMRPLEFSAFPTVLLVATMLRLALNVASTRVVLMNGHTGPDAAGQVIRAFGEFVLGGHYVIGLIVFAILTVINFVVVTKGAGRISEVSARFILDAMPGKQMAIDADLNAGVLSREEARARREEIREEADFYGAMDGASKFVRGDAVAGILILLINLVGGLVIGTTEHGLSLGQAMQTYSLLTIGDGLVAQIPALLLSTAVAILVTRISRPQDMGNQLSSQLFGQPRALMLTAAILFVIGLIPGMPNLSFLLLGSVCAAAALLLQRRAAAAKEAPAEEAQAGQEATAQQTAELSWEDVRPVDALGVEIGYRLIPMADARQDGELMARIRGVRRKLTQELGFLIPAVHVRDNLDLPPNGYRIIVQGVPAGRGEVYPDRFMALDPGGAAGPLEGIAAKDPAFGLDAVWIPASARAHAQSLGYTVVDAATVIATHLSKLVRDHADELFGYEELEQLLRQLESVAPKLVEELTPKLLPMAVILRVMQNLLAERVPLRNLRAIAEALTEHGMRHKDPDTLTAAVRVALGRLITQEIAGESDELPVMTLAPKLERMLQEAVGNGMQVLEPTLTERLHKAIAECARQQQASGRPAVLLVSSALRPVLARLTRRTIPDLHVLAYTEVPESRQLRIVASVDV